MLFHVKGSLEFLLRNKIFLIATIVVSPLLVISCNFSGSEQGSLPRNLPGATEKPKLDCLEERDTIFSNKDYLRFVTIGDSAFDGKVRIGDKEAFLGFHFTCNMVKGLIPSVLKHTGSQLILKRGFGFHYREVIICSSRSGTIHQQRFEIEKALGAKYDFAYPDTQDSSRIIVTDLLNKKDVVLPMEHNVKSIKLFQINESALVVVDDKSQEFILPFER